MPFHFNKSKSPHNEWVRRAKMAGEHTEYRRSPNSIKAQSTFFARSRVDVLEQAARGFFQTSVNTQSLKTETIAFGYTMAEHHRASRLVWSSAQGEGF